jgi:hypothetical protein
MRVTFVVSIARTAALVAAVACAACQSERPPQSAESATPAHGAEHRPAPAAPQTAAAVAPPQTTAPAPPSAQASKPARGYSGPLPPLPRTTFPPPRPAPVVEAVYAFAAQHPEVLHYVPCFCGCESHGHVGNDDCFVASRDQNGRPTWDAHGWG